MLEGVASNNIIVGAYTDRDGRICPMLAAHRHGGRTSLASFARAWDRYTEAKGPRPATQRELRTLTAMLEASLIWEDENNELAAAARAHRETKRPRRRRPTGERDRTSELRNRIGWAWLRVFRRYDDYEAALAAAEAEPAARERDLAGVN
jgi:hypothetical protein